MTHVFQLDSSLYGSISKTGRNMLVEKTSRTIMPKDTLIFQCETYPNEELVREVINVETEGLKSSYIAFSFKEREPKD